LFAAGVAEDTVPSTAHGPARWSGGGGGLLLGEAFTAEDGAILRGAEGDSGLLATLGAGRPSFDAREVVGVAQGLRGSENGDPLGFAVLTALGRILELFVVEKQLFPSGENKVGTAVDAGQYLILKFH
jgi:hypothetical protein